MKKLSVNIDHIATLRETRKTAYPEVLVAAGICELAGADGITFHLREDRRHIKDRDAYLLKEIITTKLNFEMAATPQMSDIALKIRPNMITIVPEKRQELTTEGGLNVYDKLDELKNYLDPFKKAGILSCIFVEADIKQIEACKKLECDYVELHTGTYCNSLNSEIQTKEFNKLKNACHEAHLMGLKVTAGHGIYYNNIIPLLAIKEIEEFSIGHGIISKAIFVGLEKAIRDMKMLINQK